MERAAERLHQPKYLIAKAYHAFVPANGLEYLLIFYVDRNFMQKQLKRSDLYKIKSFSLNDVNTCTFNFGHMR